jgi:hypothetical protein
MQQQRDADVQHNQQQGHQQCHADLGHEHAAPRQGQRVQELQRTLVVFPHEKSRGQRENEHEGRDGSRCLGRRVIDVSHLLGSEGFGYDLIGIRSDALKQSCPGSKVVQDMQATTITRRKLYELVWSEPIMRLAKRYGLSDVGMAKLCTRCAIPRPPRGYWAKKQFGKATRWTPLPNPDDDFEITMTIPTESEHTSQDVRQANERQATKEKQTELKIEVAETLRGAHGLVSLANQQYQESTKRDNGLLERPDECALTLDVSKDSLRRALLMMDALLKSLEKRGYGVAAGPTVTIEETPVAFSISELVEKIREQPDDHDLDGRYEFGHSRFNRRTVPSGRLVLQINVADAHWARGGQQTWRDGKTKRVEDRLNSFVVGLLEVAARKKQHEIEEAERERQRQEDYRRRQLEAQRRAEIREQQKAERVRVEGLLQEAGQWRRSRDLRDYIEAAEHRHLTVVGTIDPDSEFAAWLEWAHQQADRLDPLAESPPSILDEDIEAIEDGRRELLRSWNNNY